MLMRWQQRLATMPQLQDFDNWPFVDPSSLPVASAKQFIRNQQIVSSVLGGEKCFRVAEKFGISKGEVSRILSRCLGGDAEQDPLLTQALIPYKNVKRRQRVKALSSFTQPTGSACSFMKLLADVPQIVSNIDTLLLGDMSDNPLGQNVTTQIAFNEFKRTLKEVKWPKNRYPYTTQSMGYYSLRTYIQNRKLELLSRNHEKQQNPQTSVFSALSHALLNIEIDEQIVDINCSIQIQLKDTIIPLRLARVSLLLAIDAATDCILGYHIAYTKSPNQQDMLSLFRSIFYPSDLRRINTPNLKAPPGKLFPSQFDGVFNRLSVGTVNFDNALIHKANSVSDYICNHLGAAINLGLPRAPNARNWVEYAFRRVNRLSHRFKSTTGSHCNDPKRESRKNKKAPPPLDLSTFEDALYVLLGTHNITPQARLGNAAPLDSLIHQITHRYVHLHPNEHDPKKCPFMGREKRSVKLLSSEDRAPYINFQGVRYTGACLYNVIEKDVDVRYNRIDIRVLNIFKLDGEYIGQVNAPKTWMHYPHSIHTRQVLLAFGRNNKFHQYDLFSEYFSHLLQEKEQPKTALEVLRLFKELSRGALDSSIVDNASFYDEKTNVTIEPNQPTQSLSKKVSDWSTSWANNEEDR